MLVTKAANDTFGLNQDKIKTHGEKETHKYLMHN